MYSIYRIASPSGKYYIGLTKSNVNERWRQHKRRAFCEDRNHPFYNAIRKYGPERFTVETIDTAGSKAEAQQKERQWIANSPKDRLYNLSPGGEADGEAGAALFWGAIKNDPERLAEYLESLSSTKRARDWSDYEGMSKKAAAWRKEHPKEAYKIARRASRIAARGAKKKDTPRDEPLKDRLRRKHKRPEVAREAAKRQWENRTEEQRAELARKISEASKKNWSRVQDSAERAKKTEAARAAIDRKKQGAAASGGLKKFWADLKADPEKYREYMERRTASLNETNRKKKSADL